MERLVLVSFRQVLGIAFVNSVCRGKFPLVGGREGVHWSLEI